MLLTVSTNKTILFMSQELFNTQLFFCRQKLEVDVLFKSGRRRRDWEKVDKDRRTRLSEEQK